MAEIGLEFQGESIVSLRHARVECQQSTGHHFTQIHHLQDGAIFQKLRGVLTCVLEVADGLTQVVGLLHHFEKAVVV